MNHPTTVVIRATIPATATPRSSRTHPQVLQDEEEEEPEEARRSVISGESPIIAEFVGGAERVMGDAISLLEMNDEA
jgi:hypothetical protein